MSADPKVHIKVEPCSCTYNPGGAHWGCAYEQGCALYATTFSHDAAFALFERAATIYGQAPAMCYLGIYHEFGLGSTKQSLSVAAAWYTKAVTTDASCGEAADGLRRVISKQSGDWSWIRGRATANTESRVAYSAKALKSA